MANRCACGCANRLRWPGHCFREGKIYIDSLDVLRCKLAGVLVLRPLRVRPGPDRAGWFPAARDYPERHGLKVWLEMVRLGVVATLKHIAGRYRKFLLPF